MPGRAGGFGMRAGRLLATGGFDAGGLDAVDFSGSPASIPAARRSLQTGSGRAVGCRVAGGFGVRGRGGCLRTGGFEAGGLDAVDFELAGLDTGGFEDAGLAALEVVGVRPLGRGPAGLGVAGLDVAGFARRGLDASRASPSRAWPSRARGAGVGRPPTTGSGAAVTLGLGGRLRRGAGLRHAFVPVGATTRGSSSATTMMITISPTMPMARARPVFGSVVAIGAALGGESFSERPAPGPSGPTCRRSSGVTLPSASASQAPVVVSRTNAAVAGTVVSAVPSVGRRGELRQLGVDRLRIDPDRRQPDRCAADRDGDHPVVGQLNRVIRCVIGEPHGRPLVDAADRTRLGRVVELDARRARGVRPVDVVEPVTIAPLVT